MNKRTVNKLKQRSEQISLLIDYTNFLLSEGYADCDVWAEEPSAIDQFMVLRDKPDKA